MVFSILNFGLWTAALEPVNEMMRFGFLTLPLIFLVLLNATGSAQSPSITTYVGPTLPVIGARAMTQSIGVPQSVAADGAGGFYVTSSSHNRVDRKSTRLNSSHITISY